jgi:hypothetical protein
MLNPHEKPWCSLGSIHNNYCGKGENMGKLCFPEEETHGKFFTASSAAYKATGLKLN